MILLVFIQIEYEILILIQGTCSGTNHLKSPFCWRAEAEEIGFATENCFDETLNQALQELMQYQHVQEDEAEVVEEDLIYEFDDIVGLENEVEIENS